MCNLCSTNHFIDDEVEWQDGEPSLCVHQTNHLYGQTQELTEQIFVAPTPMLQGSSF